MIAQHSANRDNTRVCTRDGITVMPIGREQVSLSRVFGLRKYGRPNQSQDQAAAIIKKNQQAATCTAEEHDRARRLHPQDKDVKKRNESEGGSNEL